MFCLRNWIPLLLFLTNASPIYILLFLTGNYVLTRPCVYCSVLLIVLVVSFFDFQADWFEPRWHPNTLSVTETASSFLSGNTTVTEVLGETASLAMSAINGTGGSLVSAAMTGLRKKASGGSLGASGSAASASASGFEWLRGFAERKQFRIPCIDVNVRL